MKSAIVGDLLESDVAAFLDYIRHERRLSANTRQTYEYGLTKHAAFVRSSGVADYLAPQPAELACYLEALHEHGLAAASRSLVITALQRFYQRLVSLGRLSSTAARPVQALAKSAIPERLPRVLTVEEVRKLLEAPCATAKMYLRDRALLEFLYASGCRASEIVGLRVTDLNLDAGTARVRAPATRTPNRTAQRCRVNPADSGRGGSCLPTDA